eukprot:TRINITY_DN7886_c0_g1_i1.p2 TRINITY_DN7886_c0_g1~~TRINITY_DN7886_c0_g1_i1.p2  ORF type:complete len:189 (+),score=21.41 TRINITY_DN7886_c0_g1_i1:29-568(+)
MPSSSKQRKGRAAAEASISEKLTQYVINCTKDGTATRRLSRSFMSPVSFCAPSPKRPKIAQEPVSPSTPVSSSLQFPRTPTTPTRPARPSFLISLATPTLKRPPSPTSFPTSVTSTTSPTTTTNNNRNSPSAREDDGIETPDTPPRQASTIIFDDITQDTVVSDSEDEREPTKNQEPLF